LQEMREIVTHYDVNDAQLTVEDDRDFLLKVIGELFAEDYIEEQNDAIKTSEHVDLVPLANRSFDATQAVLGSQVLSPRNSAPPSSPQRRFSIEGTQVFHLQAQLTSGEESLDVESVAIMHGQEPSVQSRRHGRFMGNFSDESQGSEGISQGTPINTPINSEDVIEAPQSHNTNGKSKSTDQGQDSVKRTLSSQRGIIAFNHAVQTLVPDQLPLRGLRSWKLFGYVEDKFRQNRIKIDKIHIVIVKIYVIRLLPCWFLEGSNCSRSWIPGVTSSMRTSNKKITTESSRI
jgi:hypothetical protein